MAPLARPVPPLVPQPEPRPLAELAAYVRCLRVAVEAQATAAVMVLGAGR